MQCRQPRVRRPFFTWSDLAFGAVLLLATWVAHCYWVGANRYTLRLDLCQKIRVSGEVRLPQEAAHLEPIRKGILMVE